MYKATSVILDWAAAVSLYALVVFIIPVSGKVFPGLNQDTADAGLNIFINVLTASVFIGLLIYLLFKPNKAPVFSYIWLLVFFIICVYFLTRVEITKDRLHFLGYGVLSVFLYRALRHAIGTQILYVWSSVFIMLFAVFDEVLQLSGSGGRAFEFKDIGLDWLSGLVGQCVIATVVRPKLEAVEIKIRGYHKELKRLKVFEQRRSVKSPRRDPTGV